MFQRLKGFNLDSFLDSKIAEEQAKQGRSPSSSSTTAAGGPSKRSSSTTGSRRGSARTGASRSRAHDGSGRAASPASLPVKSPDPEDFVIGDDSADTSRVATPKLAKENEDGETSSEQKEEDGPKADLSVSAEKGKEKAGEDGLPEEVRKKLIKLDTMTTRYQDLLRNYRTAHARVSAIEPFEATLREHTPLTSIGEPGALVEFLNQRSLQSEMVMEELKRLSAENREVIKERDELKVKLEDAEKKANEAFDEAAGLREVRKANSDAAEDKKDKDCDPLGVNAMKEDGKKATAATTESDQDETFFSYETELPRLEAESKQHQEELHEQRQYIDELSTENATLRQDLDIRMLDISAAHNKISLKEREIDSLQSRLSEAQNAHVQVATIEQSPKDAEREKKMREVQERVITHLKEEVEQARDAKRTAEGRANELRFEIKKLESEANASGEIITRLRDNETNVGQMRKQVTAAERERDEARRLVETKKGHEAAVASLRSQLKRTEQDRDAAYQMILDCGKCVIPEPDAEKSAPATPGQSQTVDSEMTGTSIQPTEVGSPSAESAAPAAGESKKSKKKKKSKAKKQEAGAEAGNQPNAGTQGEAADTRPTTVVGLDVSKSELSEKWQKSLAENGDNPFLNTERFNELMSEAEPETVQKLVRQFFEQAVTRMSEHRLQEAQEHEGLLAHHEQVIEERERTIWEKDQRIDALEEVINTKNIVVEESMQKLREAESERDAMKEANEDLKDSLTELGSQATDAKFELKEVKEQRRKLQEELDELQATYDSQRGLLKEAEAQRQELQTLNESLTTQMGALKEEGTAASADQLRNITEKLQASEAAALALQSAKDAFEKQIAELKSQHTESSSASNDKLKALEADLEASRVRSSELEKDLAAANQLAQSRFRDLSDLREHVNAAQPELKRLRDELAETKEAKAALEKSTASLSKLEAKEKALRTEVTDYRNQIVEKNKEIASLKEKAKKGEERATALEDTYEKARRDLEHNEKTRDEAVERREKARSELKKAQEELKTSRASLDELEKKVHSFRDEANRMRDELQLKSAQQASAQSLLDSMQDQTRELATQMKELRERNDSLDEELADAHRLLSERGREGETMRRLLADVESRADTRVKEMRERMELALEERDRAEDEASGLGRRKARELEELKGKLRDAERDLARATDARLDAERRERDLRSGDDEVRRSAARAQEELVEVRAAMAQLRDALDEGERQAREGEKGRVALKRTLEEREARLEKLQKSSKAMAEELRAVQTKAAASSRSSLESSSTNRVLSPARGAANGGGAKEPLDYVYLKNVLLQFVEQREKKHQMQLVPVLAMLLHFDKQDEQKWLTAISAR